MSDEKPKTTKPTTKTNDEKPETTATPVETPETSDDTSDETPDEAAPKTSDEKKKTVKVKAMQLHTHAGKEYKPGDVYEIDEQMVDSLRVQGKAAVDDETTDDAKAPKATATKTTAVDPMTLKKK